MGEVRNHNVSATRQPAEPTTPQTTPTAATENPPEESHHQPRSGHGTGTPASEDWRSSYRWIAGHREFQALWLAHALSTAGNYLLSIAVTVLVYQQTSSALAAGFTLALTYLPQIIGGPLLAGFADLLPRRRVMLISDTIRALLVLGIGIPGMPLWALWTLLFLSILPMVPFGAARAAMLAEIVQGDRYVAGSAIINLTTHGGALVGLLIGGGVLTLIGPNATVMGNGLTFLISAGIILLGVRHRPAPTDHAGDRPTLWNVTRDGTRLVFGDTRLRTLALLAWLAGCYSVPLGVANPLAAEIGAGASAVSVIMASVPAGALIGGFVLTRLIDPATRIHLIGPLAVMASVPLLVWFLHPPLWVMSLLLTVSGACGAYQLVANAAFVLCVPAEGRGLAFGLVASGLQAAQGIGMVLGSMLVDGIGSHLTITLAGALGTAGAVVLALLWHRLRHDTVELLHESRAAGAAPS